MPLTISSIFNNCLQTILPCWFGDIPYEKESGDEISRDWTVVEVYKRGMDGQFIRTAKLDEDGGKIYDKLGDEILVPKKYLYSVDSKGNLFGYWNGKMIKSPWSEKMVPMIETKGVISAKFAAIFVLTIPYILSVMSAHLLHLVYDVYRISKKALMDFAMAIKNCKGLFSATFNTIFIFSWKIPTVVMHDLWGTVRCLFFAVGMLFASGCGTCFPLEGRRWYSKIEGQLHYNARAFQHPYCMRIDLWTEGEYSRFFKDLFSRINWERPFYLGWCMLKKGNIHQYKFQRVISEEKAVEKESSWNWKKFFLQQKVN